MYIVPYFLPSTLLTRLGPGRPHMRLDLMMMRESSVYVTSIFFDRVLKARLQCETCLNSVVPLGRE